MGLGDVVRGSNKEEELRMGNSGERLMGLVDGWERMSRKREK